MDRQWQLRGRLTPPSYRVSLLATSALKRLQADGLSHKAAIITGPAGYGKTALLAQWRTSLLQSGIRTAWISLSGEQVDSGQLLTLLAMSLIDAGVDLGPLENIVEQWFADTPVAAAVQTLAAQLERHARPIVVLVDDAHLLNRPVAEQVFGPLLDSSLAHVHLVFAGRSRPSMPLADLRLRGEMLEFDAASLRFSDVEIATLLPDLTGEQRALLGARTEGWPVAMQLARMWLAAKPERIELIAGFSGRTLEVADYLTEQVLSDLPASVYATLEVTSPLEAVCAGVVTAVTGRDESWSEVVAVPSLAHLVVPLDDVREWYRLHPLFADYLRDRLHRIDPRTERACHERASEWFEREGLHRQAVHHAVAAGDVARAAALVEKTGGWELVVFGGAGLMRALLAEIPEHRLREFPRVEVFRAFVDAKAGAVVDARRRFDEAQRMVLTSGVAPTLATPIGRDLYIVGHLLARYEDRPVAADALESIYREFDALATDDAIGRAALLNTACLLGFALGDMVRTRDACDRAVREMRSLGSVLGINYCTLHLGLATLHLGHRREAEAMFREALELAEENFGADSGLRAVADIHLAVALVARGEMSEAAELFARSLGHIEQYDGWLDIYAEGYAAAIDVALATEGIRAAHAVVDRASLTAKRRGLARLHSLAAVYRARLALLEGRSDEARKLLAAEEPPNATGWRERVAWSLVRAEQLLASGDAESAQRVLLPIAHESGAACRIRDQRRALFLSAIAEHSAGRRDAAVAALVALLEPAVREDDVRFLEEARALATPLLQSARQWTRDLGASPLLRQALGLALDGLSGLDQDRSPTAAIGLSAREREVLAELGKGAPNKVIARALQMTENTVKFHLKNLFHKLGVRHRAQAIRAARELGLLHD